jgi:hypothetical protein
MWLEVLGKLIKFIDFIRSQIQDLLACSILPQPLHYHMPQNELYTYSYMGGCNAVVSLSCAVYLRGELAFDTLVRCISNILSINCSGMSQNMSGHICNIVVQYYLSEINSAINTL